MAARVGALLLALSLGASALAQHEHARGHDDYAAWASGKTGHCCNDQDCGALADDEWREAGAGPEIRIAGEWCPVRREHFIIRGRSPDWNVAHACVLKNEHVPACERLLCFAGKGGF